MCGAHHNFYSVGYVSGRRVTHNNITVHNCLFENNSAGRGGAVSFFCSRYRTYINNRLQFIDCNFTGNSASIGAAMSLRPTAGSSQFSGIPLTPLICRCSFINNQVINTAPFFKSGNGTAQHVVQSGIYIAY